ncbi:MAG: glycosyltransferase family 4 protein [Planctomycetota bacterium]
MHIALLANTAWLDEELASLRQLVVGLIDEHVTLTQVVPAFIPDEDTSPFAHRLDWIDSRWRFLNQRRIAALHPQLAAAKVDLIHALDGRLWPAAVKLAERLDLPLLLSASSAHDLSAAARIVRHLRPDAAAFTAATEPLTSALRARVPESIPVHLVPPGVHRLDASPRPTDRPLCAVITGSGRHDSYIQALLEALARVIRRDPQAQFFFDGQTNDQHRIWQAADKLGLLRHISLVPRKLGNRDLLLRTDALLMPQPLGKARSLTLQAMARGLPVVATDDPWLDYLIDGETAWMLSHPEPTGWHDRIVHLLDYHESATAMGHAARAWVNEHRPVTKQIDALLDLYRRYTGQTIPMAQAG